MCYSRHPTRPLILPRLSRLRVPAFRLRECHSSMKSAQTLTTADATGRHAHCSKIESEWHNKLPVDRQADWQRRHSHGKSRADRTIIHHCRHCLSIADPRAASTLCTLRQRKALLARFPHVRALLLLRLVFRARRRVLDRRHGDQPGGNRVSGCHWSHTALDSSGSPPTPPYHRYWRHYPAPYPTVSTFEELLDGPRFYASSSQATLGWEQHA
jgi:hypothetical protein